jgi:hypothetical protein
MKKINLYPILLAMLISLSPVHLFASDGESPVATPAAEAARAEVLINRLEEIKRMDMSTLSRAEKKELRNEVRETKKELKTNKSGGVYLSLGALLLVIILLILLL